MQVTTAGLNDRPDKLLREPGVTYDRLTRWEVIALLVLLVLMLVFGYMSLRRQALHGNQMSDLDVYGRAAWAVVHDPSQLYTITNDDGWGYTYPPAFAVVMSPFQYPPVEMSEQGWLSWPVMVVIWTALSLGLTWLSVDVLASALERASSDQGVRDRPKFCRDWWGIRVVPLLVCMPSVMSSIVRGQTDPLLLAGFCLMAAWAIRGRFIASGAALSAAIFVKIIPGMLVLYPLWRRQWRLLGGIVIGGVVLGVVLPVVVFGPTTAFELNKTFANVVLLPGLGIGADDSRSAYLTGITTTDNSSFKAILHHLTNFHLPRHERPLDAAPWVKLTHWAAMLLMLAVTFWAAGWKKIDRAALSPTTPGSDVRTPLNEVLFMGLLIQLMLLFSPVTHFHYYMLWVPLVMAVLMVDREDRQRVGISGYVALLIGLLFLAGLLPRIPWHDLFDVPGLLRVRDAGLLLWGTLGLWAVGVMMLRRREQAARKVVAEPAGEAEPVATGGAV